MKPFRHARVLLLIVAVSLSSACRTADAVVDDAAAKCRSTLAVQERGYADLVLGKMVTCARDRMRGKLAADTACGDLDAASFPSRSAGAIVNAHARLVSRISAACAAVTPSVLGYATCPSPCGALVPQLASFSDVADCVACVVADQAEEAVAELYGASPPVLGKGSKAERCQTSYVAGQAKTYVRTVLQDRRACQAKVDTGKLAATDCATTDVNGSIAKAAAKLTAGVARCSAEDLAALTSCSSTVAGEQACTLASGDAVADALFALVRPTGGGSTTSCAADDFLDLTGAPGAGAGYAAPTLSASCTDDEVVVTSNSITPYTFVQTTPNALVVNQKTYHFPRTPVVAASTTTVPLLNTIAIAVNGLPIFGPNEAMMPDPYGDPVTNGLLDQCLGHTAYIYHYHALVVKCLTQAGLVAQPWTLADPPASEPSPVVGYALDGFPIYGPYGCVDAACSQVIEFQSSWDNTGYASLDCTTSADCASGYRCGAAMIDGVRRNACVAKTYAWSNNAYHAKSGVEFLDQCNGHYGPDGSYHYHATATFPYVLGCYRGTPTNNGGTGAP